MKKLLFLALTISLFTSCRHARNELSAAPRLTTDLLLKTTPVKDQGHSSLCWAYAMLATMETEHLMQGDSVNLSADYTARMYLREQALQRIYVPRGAKEQQDPITTRGMAPMLISLIQTYGLQHQDAFHREESTDYDVIARRLTQMTAAFPKASVRSIDDYLDKQIGFLPRQVFMYGVLYTPQEFAHSVCRPDEYTPVTSFLHHPYGQAFPLEVPDNYYRSTFQNVPLDSMMQIIVQSLKRKHPVCWEGDSSEPGFDWANGIADVQPSELPITEKERQQQFENHQTTDDHCMEIVGMAHDAQGKKYFICKNSWGKTNRYGGFMFLSFDYVKLKTIAIVAKL